MGLDLGSPLCSVQMELLRHRPTLSISQAEFPPFMHKVQRNQKEFGKREEKQKESDSAVIGGEVQQDLGSSFLTP